MKIHFIAWLFYVALLVMGSVTAAHADSDRPRQTGVACARAGNAYCHEGP